MYTSLNNVNPGKGDLDIFTTKQKSDNDEIISLYITPYKQFYLINVTPRFIDNKVENIKTKTHLTSKEGFDWIEENCPEHEDTVIGIINDKKSTVDKVIKDNISGACDIFTIIKNNPNCSNDYVCGVSKKTIKYTRTAISNLISNGLVVRVNGLLTAVSDIYLPKAKYAKHLKNVKAKLNQLPVKIEKVEIMDNVKKLNEINIEIDKLKNMEKIIEKEQVEKVQEPSEVITLFGNNLEILKNYQQYLTQQFGFEPTYMQTIENILGNIHRFIPQHLKGAPSMAPGVSSQAFINPNYFPQPPQSSFIHMNPR